MKKLQIIVVLVLMGGFNHVTGQDIERFEALFIYKFSDYIIWPEAKAPEVVGILDNNAILEQLNKVASSSGKITTVKPDGLSKIDNCDIVYLGTIKAANLEHATVAAKNNHILLVTKGEEYVGKGSCIGFYTDGGRLKFAISTKTMAVYQLKASNTLTSPGKIVKW